MNLKVRPLRFDVKLTTITPVHIGTGHELMKDIDFIIRSTQDNKEQTIRLDVDRLLMDHWDEKDREGLKPGKIWRDLAPDQRQAYIAYRAMGAIAADTPGSKLLECIKTPDYRPYIPGSSLKGALRTALAWDHFSERVKGVPRPEERRSQFAAQSTEADIFASGGNRVKPNNDIMRALQVGDLHVSSKPVLQVLNIRVASYDKFDSPIEVEAVTDTSFSGQLMLDQVLLQNDIASKLGFGDRVAWLNTIEALCASVNRWSSYLAGQCVIAFEQKDIDSASRVTKAMESIQGIIAELPVNECILPLGWGTGWEAKTYGKHLKRDEEAFAQLVTRYKIQRVGRGKRVFQVGDHFPKTHRVVTDGDNRNPRIKGVMGWVHLVFAETPFAGTGL